MDSYWEHLYGWLRLISTSVVYHQTRHEEKCAFLEVLRAEIKRVEDACDD